VRIRTVKPEFFSHPEVASVSIPARLLLISLWTQADDEGRLYDQPTKIRGLAFAEEDKVNVPRMLAELEAAQRILRYIAEEKHCIQIVHFDRHQRVNRRTPSVIPPPLLTDPSVRTHGGLTEDSPLEGKGRERNREGKGTIAPRERDALFETIAEVCGIDWHDLTDTARGSLNRAVAQIRAVCQDPTEVRSRASNWSYDVPLTPPGLAKHWPSLAQPRGAFKPSTVRQLTRAERLEAEGM